MHSSTQNMKDKILEGYVNAFAEEFDLRHLDPPIIFEHFSNYCVTSKQYPRDFSLEDLSVGGTDDTGLDGAVFIVNGNIICSPEEIDYLIAQSGYITVSFIFIQTKSSSSFKAEQISTFVFGIKNLFSSDPLVPENEQISNLRKIKDKIYQNSISLQSSPTLSLYFVTSGEWKEPKQVTGRITNELRELESQKLFSSILFNYYDAEKLKQSYREINRKTIKEIKFGNHVALPEISGVRQSFVGSMSVKEYVKLISDDDGNLQKYLFEDNVRDFQGGNKVNKAIAKTIGSQSEQAALSVYNNGITIIAKQVDQIGKTMKLTDFQIVNGCQTSHVLFENQSILQDETHIVVKIVETTNNEFANNIVRATNQQTEVKDEAFESLSQFHKDLEEFYKARSKTDPIPIFYERRSKQYESSPTVKRSQVITLPTQINTYVSAKLGQPQSTHRYYGELLESNRSKMFNSRDRLEDYYIAGLTLKVIEKALTNKSSDKRRQIFKYHILYLVYGFLLEKKSRMGQKYSFDNVVTDLCDQAIIHPVIRAAQDTIETCLKRGKLHPNEASRSKAFTDSLKNELRHQFSGRHRESK